MYLSKSKNLTEQQQSVFQQAQVLWEELCIQQHCLKSHLHLSVKFIKKMYCRGGIIFLNMLFLPWWISIKLGYFSPWQKWIKLSMLSKLCHHDLSFYCHCYCMFSKALYWGSKIYIFFRNKTVIFKYLCWSNEHGNQSYTTLVSLLSLNHILIPCHIPVVFSSSFYIISSVESKSHHREIEEMAEMEKSYQWLDKTGLKDSTDAWIMAAQKQPLSKRSIEAGVYHSR